MVNRIALWTLTGSPEHPTATQGYFPTSMYSLFKHGEASATVELGEQLAHALIEARPDVLTSSVAPIFPVAYVRVVPACYNLASVMVSVLNEHRQRDDLAPARIVHVRKSHVTTTHYAAASAADRAADLASLDFVLTESVEPGAPCVIVDDIVVTGAAEACIVNALTAGGVAPDAMIFTYLAQVDDDLKGSPQVEAAINSARVATPRDMLPAMLRGDWQITIRYVKDVLGDPALANWAHEMPRDVAMAILDGARSTGPQFCALYSDGIAVLHKVIDKG